MPEYFLSKASISSVIPERSITSSAFNSVIPLGTMAFPSLEIAATISLSKVSKSISFLPINSGS